MSPQEQSRCQKVMDEASRCHPGGRKGRAARCCTEVEEKSQMGLQPSSILRIHQELPAPAWSIPAQLPHGPCGGGSVTLSPLPPPRASPRSWKGCKSPTAARLVTAAEFMNLSEWKKAGSLYHIQRKLSFKRKFSVITLKGAILTQSVTTLTCC